MENFQNIEQFLNRLYVDFYSRVVYWNITRQHMTYNQDLENAMLTEEYLEYLETSMNNENINDKETFLAERTDAVCDYFFVLLGTKFKVSLEPFLQQVDEMVINHAECRGRTLLTLLRKDFGLHDTSEDNKKFQSFLVECMTAVCDANDLKGNTKSKSGKVEKGELWKDPKDEIKKIIIKTFF